MSRNVVEPHQKNLFLQSLTEEEHGKTDVSENDHGCSSQRQIQDRDLVECLENDVKYWTDFSKVQYHTRSLYELSSSWIDIQRFDNYGMGKDILSGGLQVEEINERLRLIVEECDHIQVIFYSIFGSSWCMYRLNNLCLFCFKLFNSDLCAVSAGRYFDIRFG